MINQHRHYPKQETYKNHAITCKFQFIHPMMGATQQTPMISGGKKQWCLNQPYYQLKTLGDEENSFVILTIPSPFESQKLKV